MILLKDFMHLIYSLIFLLITSSGSAQISAQPLFQFGVIADVQYCDCDNSGTRYYRLSPRKLNEAVSIFNELDLAFVASLGDFIDRDFDSFDTLNQIVSNLRHPLWHAIGNHEWSVLDSLKAEVTAQLGVTERYYSKLVNGWRFIFLDGNAVSLYGTAKGSDSYQLAEHMLDSMSQANAPNAKSWNGALGPEQLKWVEKELQSARSMDQKVIFMCHFPMYPLSEAHNLWDDRALFDMITRYDNAVAYFNGHVHRGSYEEFDRKHYLVFEGMVEKASNAFAIVSVYPTHLEIKGFGREKDRVLKVY